jgi:DNA polymerase-4
MILTAPSVPVNQSPRPFCARQKFRAVSPLMNPYVLRTMALMRKIIHVDMDCFFAAVEVRENPALKGLPIAVGGSTSRRGVISTCSYEARKFGVRSAMATALAKKLCPQLIVLKHSGAKYREASEIVHGIFRKYTPLVQSMGMDEAYLDVTDVDLPMGSATFLAQRIRAEIFAATQLTASAGIASNKLLAKLASEANKPNGQCTIAPKDVAAFMPPLELKKLHGIGPVTAKRLLEDGFRTCADILALSRFQLSQRLGESMAAWLYDACRGIDDREVITEWERKSLSCETTYAQDLADPEIIRPQLAALVEELKADLENYDDRVVKGFQVKIKYHDFKQTTIERAGTTADEAIAWELFLQRWSLDPRPIRLLGVGVRFESEEVEESPQLAFDALCETG